MLLLKLKKVIAQPLKQPKPQLDIKERRNKSHLQLMLENNTFSKIILVVKIIQEPRQPKLEQKWEVVLSQLKT